MIDADQVREAVRKKLESGVLPLTLPDAVHGRTGSGRNCAACGYRIETTQREIETHCTDGRTQHYHAQCNMIVVAERQRLLGDGRK